MCIVITGIPGVGKSTVMEGVAKIRNIPIVNFGTVMFDIAKENGTVKERDEIRKLPLEIQKEIQILASEKIGKMGKVFVDTHCTVKTKKGYLPGLPEWVLRKLKPEVIVLIESSAEEIANRRTNDPNRNRDKDAIEDINEHQKFNRAIALAYSVLTGATVKIIYNRDGKVDLAIKELMEVI